MTTQTPPHSEAEVNARLEDADRRGFRRGLSVSMSVLAVLCAIWTIYRVLFDSPRFEEVFRQVKVEMPYITVLLLSYPSALCGTLAAVAMACVFTVSKHGNHPAALGICVASFLFEAFALAMVTIALFQPLISLLEGLGGRRH